MSAPSARTPNAPPNAHPLRSEPVWARDPSFGAVELPSLLAVPLLAVAALAPSVAPSAFALLAEPFDAADA